MLFNLLPWPTGLEHRSQITQRLLLYLKTLLWGFLLCISGGHIIQHILSLSYWGDLFDIRHSGILKKRTLPIIFLIFRGTWQVQMQVLQENEEKKMMESFIYDKALGQRLYGKSGLCSALPLAGPYDSHKTG